MIGAVVGVTDMEASIRFYSEVLGYTTIKSDTTGRFSKNYFLPSADKQCRRVILEAPQREGAFAALFGGSTIELVQALERTPRKIYEGRKIQSFTELKPGDYVVHENHGLGIYRGIEKVEVEKKLKDYMKF